VLARAQLYLLSTLIDLSRRLLSLPEACSPWRVVGERFRSNGSEAMGKPGAKAGELLYR
jgi:hypothetical protein